MSVWIPHTYKIKSDTLLLICLMSTWFLVQLEELCQPEKIVLSGYSSPAWLEEILLDLCMLFYYSIRSY